VFEDSEEGAAVFPVNHGQKVKEIIEKIRNRNVTGEEDIDFILMFNYDINFFGRNIKLGSKIYDYIRIDAPLLNHEDWEKKIATNRYLKGDSIEDKIPFSHEMVEVIPFAFYKLNQTFDGYELAEFNIFVHIRPK